MQTTSSLHTSSTPSLCGFEQDLRNAVAKDSWKNIVINLSTLPQANAEENKEPITALFNEIIEKEKGVDIDKQAHHLVLKIKSDVSQTNCYQWAQLNGFNPHHVKNGEMLLTKCIHAGKECLYPGYNTLDLGITLVLFGKNPENGDLEFVAVEEQRGGYLGKKAITGAVDADRETLSQAAVREAFEETGVEIEEQTLRYVGVINQTGSRPDVNHIFMASIDYNLTLTRKEGEIKNVSWTSVNRFLESEIPVRHTSKPLVVQAVVKKALDALQNNHEGSQLTAYYASGRSVTIYTT